MVREGLSDVPLIVESAQVFDTHHVALLIAAGASAVVPYLADEFAESLEPGGADRMRTAITAGLRKVLARMGVSTLASYRNSHLFEIVGLSEDLCAEYFRRRRRLSRLQNSRRSLRRLCPHAHSRFLRRIRRARRRWPLPLPQRRRTPRHFARSRSPHACPRARSRIRQIRRLRGIGRASGHRLSPRFARNRSRHARPRRRSGIR